MGQTTEVRVLRGDVIHGPFTREQVRDLLARGRITDADMVSVQNGPWVRVAEYLGIYSAPPADHRPAPPPPAPTFTELVRNVQGLFAERGESMGPPPPQPDNIPEQGQDVFAEMVQVTLRNPRRLLDKAKGHRKTPVLIAAGVLVLATTVGLASETVELAVGLGLPAAPILSLLFRSRAKSN
jgi:hypothetical protein